MKNLKRVLTLVLALAMILSYSVVFAAAPTSDVEDDDVKEAVERLSYLGIVAGKDDGLYHPEENLTREQFAKLVVESMGLGDAAVASNGSSVFADVAADRWSSGYVTVAAGKGIIKGKGDGTFDPEAPVTYPEAVTMLVRSLGYKDDFLVGAWPSNYVAKAAELDIPLGAIYSATGVVNRGAAAVLVNNTLDAETITQNSYGDENSWGKSGKTLLVEKMDITKVKDTTITAVARVDGSLDAGEVNIDAAGWTKDYELLNQSDIGLLGTKGDAYFNDDDEIVYFDVKTDADDIVTGMITAVAAKVKIQFADGSDEEYTDVTVGGGADDIYIDNASAAAGAVAVDQYGTFILDDDGDIKFMDIYNIDNVVCVTDVNEAKGYIKGIKKNVDDKKVTIDDQDGFKIFKDAEEIGFDDVEVNDVAMFAEAVNEVDGDTYDYVFIVSNSVEGSLTKAKDAKIYIDGDSYNAADLAGVAIAAYSLNDSEDVAQYTGAAKVEDAMAEDVVAYLDLKGEFVYVVADVNVTSDTIYGIVTKDNEITSDKVKILNGDGDEVIYTLDDDVSKTVVDDGDIVYFEVGADGTIDYDAAAASSDYTRVADSADVGAKDGAQAVAYEVNITKFDDDDDSFTVLTGTTGASTDLDCPAGKYYVTDDTKLFSYFKDTTTAIDPAIVNWDDIKAKTVGAGLNAVVILDGDDINAKMIVFTDNYGLTGDTTVGYLNDDPYYDGDWKVLVVAADGTEAEYILADKNDKAGLNEGDVVVYNTNNDGEMEAFDVTVRDNVYSTAFTGSLGPIVAGTTYALSSDAVTTVSSDVIKLDNATTAKVLSTTGFYTLVLDDSGDFDEMTEADLSDVDADDVVQLVIDDDGDLAMVIIIDDSELPGINNAAGISDETDN